MDLDTAKAGSGKKDNSDCLNCATRAEETQSLGNIGKIWQFPSDHIPLAANINDIKIATWNILNKEWISYFEQTSAGLRGSNLISDNHPASPESALTVREINSLTMILSLLEKLDLVLLQECSSDVLFALRKDLPKKFEIIRGSPGNPINDIVAIYDSDRLRLIEEHSEIVAQGYECKSNRAIMKLFFESANGQKIRVIHSHVPGDPKLPGLAEFVNYINNNASDSITTVVAGDLNFTWEEVSKTLQRFNMEEFVNLCPLNSSVGEHGALKGIDFILAKSPNGPCNLINPEFLSPEISRVTELINPLRLA